MKLFHPVSSKIYKKVKPLHLQGGDLKKSCLWCKIVPFLCNAFFELYGIFKNIVWNLFWYSDGPNKNPRNFFSSFNSNVQKCKNVYLYDFYQILKFYQYWNNESQKIRKIVKRKFAIFSSALVFKKTLIFNGSAHHFVLLNCWFWEKKSFADFCLPIGVPKKIQKYF